MSEGVDTTIEEAHGELSLARVALADDDLDHAAGHLAGAIAHAPGLPEAHELLAVLAARSPDGGLGLFPLEQRNFIGTVVAHAHLLAGIEPERALTMLAQATAYEPGKPWADVAWVRAADAATLDPQALVRVFTTVMRPVGDPATPEVCAVNQVYLDLARRAVAAHPDHAMVHATAAGLGRRLGATGEAVRWGERAVRLEPSKLSLVWYAYALKADGNLPAGLDVLRDACRRYPLDLDLCADLAEWLAESDRLDEALAVAEQAVTIDESYDCVVHTLHRLRFWRDGDPGHLVALADYIRAHPAADHEHHDLERCCQGRDWLGRPAPAGEACINVLGKLPDPPTAGLARLSLSALEVPSALAVVRRVSPDVIVEIQGSPPADMVAPLRPGRPLWRYAGTVAEPAVAPPAPASSALLRELVMPSWGHPIAAYDHALPLGELPLSQLLALLVHPPLPRADFADFPPGWWERCAQVFAGLGILHCRELAGAHPGDTAARRRVLTELVWGVEDWTTEAAVFALVVAGWLDPECRAEVTETVGRRFLAGVQASRERAVTILPSLAALARITPGMLPEVLGLAADVLAEEESRPEPPQPPAARKRSLLRRLFRRR